MRFNTQKIQALRKLSAAMMECRVDERLIAFNGHLNGLTDFFTTSGCSGRICLLDDRGSKMESVFLGRWHDYVEAKDVFDALGLGEGLVWFNFEPAILHVVARTLDAAEKLLRIGLESGFKRTGLITLREDRFVVEVLSTERVAVPVSDAGEHLVEVEYIEYLCKLGNKKLSDNHAKLERLADKVLGMTD